MHIYIDYVTPSQLISPVNGYTCQRITKQNIKQFGFNTTEELHSYYPDFPLMCDEYHQKVITASSLGFNSARAIRGRNVERRLNAEIDAYCVSPRICPKCGKKISFERRNNTFCSRKCGNSRIQTEESNRKRALKLKLPEKCIIHIKKCRRCASSFVTSIQKGNSKQKLCCVCKDKHSTKTTKMCRACNKNPSKEKGKYCESCTPNIAIYRSRASFNFNVYHYPEEFNLSLIEEYGWYSPNGYKRRNKKSNLSGVSRDHMYSILDGFENNIDPVILSHPANCRIMVHNGKGGNNSKNRKSEITIDELLKRIDRWDVKYGGSPQI